MAEPDVATEIARLPLAEEVMRVLVRRRRTRVRVAVTTAEEQQDLQAVLHHRRAEVERVPIGREVEQPPPIRQEGDTLIVPVLEERLVVVRRLVVTEEIHFRFRTEEEAVSVPATLRRQYVAVDRQPVESPDDIRATHSGEHPIMQRTLTAFFDSRAEADRAAEALRGLNVSVSNVQVHDGNASGAAGSDQRLSTTTMGGTWLPEEDRATYHEGLRRGGAIVTAEVDEAGMELAMDAMEAAGAVDLEQREAAWRSEGWTGLIPGDAAPDGAPGNPPGTMASRAVDKTLGTNVSGAHPENERRGAATGAGSVMGETARAAGGKATAGKATTVRDGQEEAIPIAEEHLRVGKRVAHGGRVRVRSYVVETPVEEQVRLREEHVRVERRPANSPGVAGEELFRERVIEADESVEEAVVQKEARVTGEVVVNKDTTERTETVRDTVRRTEVDVDPSTAANDPKRRGGKGAA